MVQPRERKPSLLETIRQQAEEMKKNSPVVDTRWYVVEITPAYNTGGYYDQDIPKQVKIVSPYFDSPSEAVEWMNDHVPDEGKSLKVEFQNLRRFTETRWVSW